MKIKLIPAYEKDSSITVRLTPQSIAELLSNMSDTEYLVAMAELLKIQLIISPKTKANQITSLEKYINELAKNIEILDESK